MRRWAWKILVLLSILCALAVVGDRIAQRWTFHWIALQFWDSGQVEQITYGVGITGGNGVILLSTYTIANEPGQEPVTRGHIDYGAIPGGMGWQLNNTWLGRAGFGVSKYQAVRGPNQSARWVLIRYVEAPNWFLAVTFFVPPLLVWRKRFRRRGRIAKGLCITCGYDLRASTQRRPECGTVLSSDRTNPPEQPIAE